MSDLTDKMRTCAAYLLTTQLVGNYDAVADAADLLIEASNLIEAAPPGPPVQLLEPVTATEIQDARDILHEVVNRTLGRQASPHACPRCDSRAAKTVRREGRRLMLVCPVCATAWEWKPKAEWR